MLINSCLLRLLLNSMKMFYYVSFRVVDYKPGTFSESGENLLSYRATEKENQYRVALKFCGFYFFFTIFADFLTISKTSSRKK